MSNEGVTVIFIVLGELVPQLFEAVTLSVPLVAVDEKEKAMLLPLPFIVAPEPL